MQASLSDLLAYQAPIVTSFGLICDIIGAVLLATDVINVYKEEPFYTTGTDFNFNDRNPKLTEHKIKNKKIALRGLGVIVFGFLLQFYSAWIPVLSKDQPDIQTAQCTEKHSPSIQTLCI